jgi:hypothetical protein
MNKIPIKINPAESDKNQSIPFHNLSQNGKKISQLKPKRGLFFWLLIVFAFIEAGGIAYLFLTNVTPPFYYLIPQDSASTIYFSQSSINSLTKSLKDSHFDWAPFNITEKGFSDFLTRNNLNLTDINSILEDKMVLILLPASQQGGLRWLFLANIKKSLPDVLTVTEKTKKNLKQNFNLTSEMYRQIEIIEIKNFNQNSNGIYFALPNNLLILSNNITALKNTIDRSVK